MVKIKGGYYIKARCIKNSTIANSPPYVREIWDYLLREANHKDNKYSSYALKRGQLFRSYREIRDALSWKVGYRTERYNENQMKMGMRYLMKQLMITVMKQPRGNIITILNYDFFQNPKNYEATNEATNETTNGQPMGNQGVLSINKNDKNVNNKKEISDSIEYRLANYLLNFILKRNPNHKKPNIQSWAKHIDLMLRIDKRSVEDIKAVIKWCQNDTPDKQQDKKWKGWANNILSTKTLRNKFDKIYLQMSEAQPKISDPITNQPPIEDILS